tara:strand:- start:1513 stop:1782 length:270 start_codon:yes stop_codon:yes gene_type:complete
MKENKISGERVRLYMEFMYGECDYCSDSLAYASNEAVLQFDHDDVWDMFRLLVENKPINSLMTHDYGFHTRTGRHIINTMIGLYNEYKK